MPPAPRSAIASTVSRRAYLSPRTIAFNVQGVRLAVHRVTGEIRILHSVHAADIGRPINPMQCRGQIDGAVAMGYGWALIENMVHDEGHMVNPQLRNCRVPAFADTPHTDVFFADTDRSDRPARRQVPGRVRHQPGGAGGRQRAGQRHRRALRPPALHAGPSVQQAGQEPNDRQHRHPDQRAAGESRGLRTLAGRDRAPSSRASRASSSSG